MLFLIVDGRTHTVPPDDSHIVIATSMLQQELRAYIEQILFQQKTSPTNQPLYCHPSFLGDSLRNKIP